MHFRLRKSVFWGLSFGATETKSDSRELIGTVRGLEKRCDAVLDQIVVEYEADGVWFILMMQLPVGGRARSH